MLVAIAIFIISLAVLLKSADIFTDNVELLGKKFNIPSFILGVTIVAAGTSLPELATSLMAIGDAPEIVLGNVIGSNIANILLIIGVCTLVLTKETEITWDLYHGDITYLIVATIILGIVLMDGYVSIIEAALLIMGYVLYTLYNVDVNSKKDNPEKDSELKFNYVNVLQMIAGIALVIISADYLVDAAITIATGLNVGSDVIGLTMIAIGTSVPELIVSFVAAKKGSIEIAIGNITGSNIFNTFIVVGIPRFFGELKVTEIIFPFTYIYMVIATVLFVSIILDKKLHRFEGAALLLMFAFFLIELFAK